jgi:hypothetical protein
LLSLLSSNVPETAAAATSGQLYFPDVTHPTGSHPETDARV